MARLYLLVFVVWSGVAGADSLQLDLGRVVHPAFVIDGLHLRLAGEGSAGELRIGHLTIGERRWHDASIRCATLLLDGGVIRCRGGTLSVPGLLARAAIDVRFDTRDRSGELKLALPGGDKLGVAMRRGGAIELRLADVAVAHLADWFPELRGWSPDGRFDGRVAYSGSGGDGGVAIAGTFRKGGFASADGLQAAENITLDIDLGARPHDAGWDWRGRIAWTGGDAYLHPLYLTAGPAVEAAGRFDSGVLAVARAELELEGVRSLAMNAEFDLQRAAVRRLALSVADADLAVIGPRYLAPALAPAEAERLHFAGHVSAAIQIEDDAATAVDVAFDEAGFSLSGEALAFGPVSGVAPWRADAETEAHLRVAGGHWQKLALGPFELVARLHGRSVDVDRVAIPVLDGTLVFAPLALRRGATGWYGSGAVVVEPISMSLFTEAVGLPPMSGVLAASLPGVRIVPGEIALNGALVISVFDGFVQATRLQWLEPFGVASHLYADVEMRHIDLAQLTDAFSFGSVTGFVDADVLGLELARWRPVRFDARIASSPGDYPKRISQRAVQNIGALGGAGAAAALQRGLLGMFETFGYREIGISCVLRGDVCRMGGLDVAGAPAGGYYIVRGGGIPALNVIGYNRRVDWNQLIDRLQRAIASNAAPVIR